MIYAKQPKRLQKTRGSYIHGFRRSVSILLKEGDQFTPQVLQACVLQEVQAGALWVTVRPSE